MNLICAVTILVGFKVTLDKNDRDALSAATQNCSKYYPEAPCLKKFIKREELVYWAICGEGEKK